MQAALVQSSKKQEHVTARHMASAADTDKPAGKPSKWRGSVFGLANQKLRHHLGKTKVDTNEKFNRLNAGLKDTRAALADIRAKVRAPLMARGGHCPCVVWGCAWWWSSCAVLHWYHRPSCSTALRRTTSCRCEVVCGWCSSVDVWVGTCVCVCVCVCVCGTRGVCVFRVCLGRVCECART